MEGGVQVEGEVESKWKGERVESKWTWRGGRNDVCKRVWVECEGVGVQGSGEGMGWKGGVGGEGAEG